MRRSMLAALGILLLAAPVMAQRPEEVVRWRAVGPAAPVKPGATLEIALSAEIEPGWHVYAMSQPQGGPRPLVIAIPKGQPFTAKVKDIVAPLPSVAADPNFNLETQFYADSVTITVPVAATRAARGKLTLPIEVTFQACSNRICLRPFTETLTVPVTIAAEPKRRAAPAATPQDCIKAGRDVMIAQQKAAGQVTADVILAASAARVDVVRACAATFDVATAKPADLAGLIDLYLDAQQPALADKALARGLAAGLAVPRHADLLSAAVRMTLRQPKSDARNAKAESYSNMLDALPETIIEQKLAAHASLNGYYRGDNIDAGIIKHSTWLIDAAKRLSPELRKKAGSSIASAYVNLAEALAGQGENDRAVDLLKRASGDLADVPNVEMRTRDPLARYMLVGTPAKAIEAPVWLNRGASSLPIDLKGAVTLVQFTAHWCGPCKESYPGIQRLRERFAGRGFNVVFVTQLYGYFDAERNLTPAEEIERDRDYFAHLKLDIPIAIGPSGRTTGADGKPAYVKDPNDKAFEVGGIPQINLVDAKGHIRLIMIGYDDANEPKLAGFIEKLVAEK